MILSIVKAEDSQRQTRSSQRQQTSLETRSQTNTNQSSQQISSCDVTRRLTRQEQEQLVSQQHKKQTTLEKLANHLDVVNNNNNINENSIQAEIKSYKNFISNKQNMTKTWSLDSKLIRLREVARLVLISPASSVPSESAFSTANYLMRKERMNIHPLSLRAQMILAEEDKIDKIF